MSVSYETVIGLEVHAQLRTQSKIFCGCSTRFGDKPNHNTCPVCLGLPGALPVLNRRVVEFAIRTGLALECEVQTRSIWARKNYFYPDLPKGYQISQYELPIALAGKLVIRPEDSDGKVGEPRTIGITRIHMEEDAGKSVHGSGRAVSLVDLNRTGTPLLEIVSEPDLRSSAEAGAYLRSLRQILRYLEVCDGNMEEGSFRCDANVSLRPEGQAKFGTRVELKNLNSFKFVEKAIEYEVSRQREVLEDGREIVQETRLYDSDRNLTRAMRSKEEAHDYRYFPDPDLLPLEVDTAWIEAMRETLPELPKARAQRFVEKYALPAYDAEVLTTERELADYFEAVVEACDNAKAASNWVMGDVLRATKEADASLGALKFSSEQLGALIRLIDSGAISGKIAKEVFADMLESGEEPKAIVERKGLAQISDRGAIEAVVDEVIAEHPAQVAQYRGGKTQIIGFLVGQVMRRTRGKANPPLVNALLQEKLGSPE